jgi:hypothetical protein
MSDKKFINGVKTSKEKTFDNGGYIVSLGCQKAELIESLSKIEADDKGWINIDIVKMKEAKGKNTHYVVENTWKPSTDGAAKETYKPINPVPAEIASNDVNDLPF